MRFKLKIICFIGALIISLSFCCLEYFSFRNYHNELQKNGKITELYTRFLTKDEADFAAQQDEFCFVTNKGDTIKYRDKNEDRFSTSELHSFMPTCKLIIYDTSKPAEHVFLEDYNSYSDYHNKILYFALALPLITIILFGMSIIFIRDLLKSW